MWKLQNPSFFMDALICTIFILLDGLSSLKMQVMSLLTSAGKR